MNLRPGDLATFVAADAPSCAPEVVNAYPHARASVGEKLDAAFTFDTAGEYALCWRFFFGQSRDLSPPADAPYAPPAEPLRFAGVRALVVTVGAASPTGTAVGCVSNVTVRGGFAAAVPHAWPVCDFGGQGRCPRLRRDRVVCATPSPDEMGSVAFRLGFTDKSSSTIGSMVVLQDFRYFSFDGVTIAASYPAGGSYNLLANVSLSGKGFVDYGAPSCRFGGAWVGARGSVAADGTSAVCEKPAFPNSVKEESATYALEFSPNGQCWPPTSASSATSSFVTYNALVATVEPAGAPAGAAVWLTVKGEGFVALAGGLCNYTRDDGTVQQAPVSTISATEVRCEPPKSVGSWTLALLLNGQAAVPFLVTAPRFKTYDIADVKVTALRPPGGPVGAPTAVTVYGEGFADLGAGQLACMVDGVRAADGLLLDSGRVLCELPAATAAGAASVTISLNNGDAGTLANALPFTRYEPPEVLGVTPDAGDANGGALVTVVGRGFTALEPGTARAEWLRCRFGATVQPVAPSYHNETAVVCNATWGEGKALVGIALNGVDFAVGTTATYSFVGLYRPTLVEAYFTSAATALVVRFGAQPTNRGGMNGMADCGRVLADETAAALQGTSEAPPQCYWDDDSTLVALLDSRTAAGPGMVVRLRDFVLWPKLWMGGRATAQLCGGLDALCATSADAVVVDADFPCDTSATSAAAEACPQPQAVVRGAPELSSCKGADLSLDGSRSSGGGVKKLSYNWRAHPTKCDNYVAVQAALDAQGDVPTVHLGGTALDGGSAFVFLLVVSNF